MPERIALISVVLIFLCMVLNHIRGSGYAFGTLVHDAVKSWPGRPLYYVAPVIGALVGIFSKNAVLGAIVMLGYFFWGVFSWGRMLDMGNLEHETADRGEPISDFILGMIPPSRMADAIAMWAREAFILPMFAAAAYWIGFPWYAAALLTVTYATAAVLMRLMAMRDPHISAKMRNAIAEMCIGVVWGAHLTLLCWIALR